MCREHFTKKSQKNRLCKVKELYKNLKKQLTKQKCLCIIGEVCMGETKNAD